MKTSLNKYLFLLLSTVCSIQASASDNTHVLRTGLLGGGSFNIMPTECAMIGKIGGSGALALDYVYYKSLNSVELGLRTGLGIGYTNAKYQAEFSQQFTNIDYLNNHIDYTTTGVVDIAQHQVHATIPLMFALRANGFVWNIGLSLQTTFLQVGNQQLSNPHIQAYYPAYNVEVVDELITGKVLEDQLQMSSEKLPFSLGCSIGTEIGYEHAINSKNAIGIMAYLNVGVWNSHLAATNLPIIQVDAIIDSKDPVPTVTINDAYRALVNAHTPLQFGVKLYYAFNLQ